MQNNVILLPTKSPFSSRIAIEVLFLPYEWRNKDKGKLQRVELDTLLQINPKFWNFRTQRPKQYFSLKNNYFHHYMIEIQIKRAEAAFEELESIMLEGKLSLNALNALYMKKVECHLIQSLKEMNWKIILS